MEKNYELLMQNKFDEFDINNINEVDEKGNNLLIKLVCNDLSKNCIKRVNFLIENDIDINHRNGSGKNALIKLITCNVTKTCKQILKKLVSCGININTCDRKGNDALFYVMTRGCYNDNDAMEILLENGATINKEACDCGQERQCPAESILISYMRYIKYKSKNI